MSFNNHLGDKGVKSVHQFMTHLKPLGINHFVHDMTFGNGEISSIGSDNSIFEIYKTQELAPICTNDSGRILASGIYLNHTLKHRPDFLNTRIRLEQFFPVKNSIHIAINEEESQHLFTFHCVLDDTDFLHMTLNSLDVIKSTTVLYQAAFSELIKEAKKSKYRIKLPYSDTLKTEFLKQNEPFALLSPLLTQREKQCLTYLAKGYNSKQIAKKLSISPRTIEFHLDNIKLKSGCATKSQLIERLAEKILFLFRIIIMKNNKFFFTLIGLIFQMMMGTVYAESGNFFSIYEDCQAITPYQVKLCLDGKGPLSCQSYMLHTSRLLIKTTIPQHVYEHVGIKIESPLYRPANCISFENGYCLFSANDVTQAPIDIISLPGMTRYAVC
jgi:DNA-binding CsgD family transcriptional regulator